MARLHISDRRERALVASADRMLAVGAAIARPLRTRRLADRPRRILLLRIERIGDLLMVLPAIADVRALAPEAEIDLVVGSWNAALAGAVPAVTHVRTLDAAWLARDGGGIGLASLVRAGLLWRGTGYDLAINFEPDLRSNLLLAMSGAAWTAGYASGGGGHLLDVALDYETADHTTDNARRLVQSVFGRAPAHRRGGDLVVPVEAHQRAAALILHARRPLVGLHVSGGRAIKQWEPDRFAETAARLVTATGATIVLTGSHADRPIVDRVKSRLPAANVIDVAGESDLLTVAAIIDTLDLLITGDTGPMHLAAAVGTPIVAVFGPSDPARYAPRGIHDRVVRVALPCSPCNRIRRPPEWCVGHTPDCLVHVTVDQVFMAAQSVLGSSAGIAHAASDRTPA